MMTLLARPSKRSALLPSAVVALLLSFSSSSTADAATALAPGDVQVVTYASDAPDAFSFVTWVSLDAGTEIFFTDKGWTCDGGSDGSFQSGESVIKFTAPSGGVPPGGVYEFVEDAHGPEWTVLSGSVAWSSLGDQIIAYQGSVESPTLIYAFDTTGGWESCGDTLDANDSVLPPALEDGVSAVSFKHYDNYWYRPWYSKSATLETLKEWMTNRDRFDYSSWTSRREYEYEVPPSFTILSGTRGSNGYTEYIPGTAPCIILTGHDGELFPESIVDRKHGCWDGSTCDWSKTCAPTHLDEEECRAVTANDENTQDMARRAADYFEEFTGGQRCHLVVNRLGRIKLDPNREVEQAAQFDSVAIDTYNDFHNFATQARAAVESSACGAGILIDFHGHVHPEARIEMGYKLSGTQLREDDVTVDTYGYTSSIKNLPTHTGVTLSDIIRGQSSFGAFFEQATTLNATGYASVPSPSTPAPAVGESYFQGGYNVLTHGSQYGGTVDAIQIEFPRYLRDDYWDMQEDVLTAFAGVVLPGFLAAHYPPACHV